MKVASHGIAPKSAEGRVNSPTGRVTLVGGVLAVVRPVRPGDGPRLAAGLRALSPESRRRRFLFSKGDFSPTELDYFTHCDGVHHLALAVVEIGWNGRERQFVAVARSIQDPADAELAEVAIAVADDWQHHGVGELLIGALARSAWEAGTRRWRALLFADNSAMRKLLALVGRKQSEHPEGAGVISLVYRLSPPSGDRPD